MLLPFCIVKEHALNAFGRYYALKAIDKDRININFITLVIQPVWRSFINHQKPKSPHKRANRVTNRPRQRHEGNNQWISFISLWATTKQPTRI